MSLGGPQDVPELHEAIQNAKGYCMLQDEEQRRFAY